MQSFTARVPLLSATSAFGLGRRRWSSQQCYLHCLRTIARKYTGLYTKNRLSLLLLLFILLILYPREYRSRGLKTIIIISKMTNLLCCKLKKNAKMRQQLRSSAQNDSLSWKLWKEGTVE